MKSKWQYFNRIIVMSKQDFGMRKDESWAWQIVPSTGQVNIPSILPSKKEKDREVAKKSKEDRRESANKI